MGKYRCLVETPGGLAEFRKDYQIPADVNLVLAEQDVDPWDNEGFVPFTLQSIIETGLRFPVQPLICEFLRQTRLCPTQLSTNTYRIIMGIDALNRQTGLNLGLAEILHQYSIGSKNDGWCYYLRIRRGREKIIKHTPDKDLNDDDFLWVSGNFEDLQAQIPGRRINWKKGEPGIHTSVVFLNFVHFGFPLFNRTNTRSIFCRFSFPPLPVRLPQPRRSTRRTTSSGKKLG